MKWYENDELWEAAAQYLLTARRIASSAAEVDKCIAMLNPPPAARILDLACGIGRHSIEFARRGFKVVGIDRSRAFIDRARTEARQQNLAIDFVETDMRAFCRPDTFDLIVNMGTSLGYFDDAEEDILVLRNMYKSLKYPGSMLLEMVSREVLLSHFKERDWHQHSESSFLLEERCPTAEWTRLANRWLVIENGSSRVFTYDQRLYSGEGLSQELKRVGFAQVRLFGNLDGRQYDMHPESLVAVAIK
jgi:SAM-dependent methyltransferase